jgi:transcriptional regulator with XRE-family HTH domain
VRKIEVGKYGMHRLAVDLSEAAPPDGAIGNRVLSRTRRAAGLTLAKLSADTGISQSQLSRFESGKRQPRAADLQRIATRLGIPVSSLYEGEQSEPRAPGRGNHSEVMLAIALDEMLLTAGFSPETAAELVAMIRQVVDVSPPAFERMTAEELTRMIVRRLAERILANRKER